EHGRRDRERPEPRGAAVGRFGQQRRDGDETGEDQGDVDQEDRTPPVAFEEPAAQERPQRQAHGHARGEQGDGPGALGAGEHAGHHGHRDRDDDGGADAHEGAGGDEEGDALGEGRGDAGGGEDRQSRQEDLLAAYAVAEESGGQEQRREHDDEGV